MWQGAVCAHMPYFHRPGHIQSVYLIVNEWISNAIQTTSTGRDPGFGKGGGSAPG